MQDGDPGRVPAPPNGVDLLQLAATELSDWPSLAQSWIDAGQSSQVLIDFAALSPGEGAVLSDLMIDVLRSLDVVVGIDCDIAGQVFSVSGFERRCLQAVARPAIDLQRTWRDVKVGVQATDQWGAPPIFVQTLTGDYNSPGTEPMTADMRDDDLVETSAKQISDTLHERIGVRWPLCVQHGRIMTPYSPETSDHQRRDDPMWWCSHHINPVAAIGALSSATATFETLWWSADRELPPLRG